MSTVTEKINEIKEKMCSQYCKYPCMTPPDDKDEDWLMDDDSPCNGCPLMEL